MLRGRPDPTPTATAYPSFETAYTLAEKPLGVQFYHARQSFFRPYALLAGMQWTTERLVLNFSHDEVIVEGRGVYELYVRLAEQRVALICEQGERYETTNQESVHVRRIQRVPYLDTPARPDVSPEPMQTEPE